MCGICGLFDGQGGLYAGAPLVRQMAATIAHRGPDNDGFYESAHCALGHRRLKIIDLSPLGRQPMTNEDGSVWISFNGEIYNYLDLRPELIDRGHHFRSQSDTEVMLHLYEDEGEDFLQQLNGMFALALWDQRRQRLLLARDRFGKKPLYYYTDGRRLLFGSEIKAILCDPEVPREFNHEAIAAYLSLGYIPAPLTIFQGIFKLPAASFLTAEADPGSGAVRLRGPNRYWNLRYQPDAGLSEADCVEEIRHLVRDATRIRLYSDVPLGAFLSGGVDSSVVVAMMAELSSKPVETFSIGFDQASFDELRYAEMIAKRFGTHHHTFRCAPNTLEVLPILVRHFDEPFADSSAIPTYYVSKIARAHVTVTLSGDGGDETFAGYTRYDNGMLRHRWASYFSDPLVRGLFRLMTEIYPVGRRGWGILHRNSLPPFDSFQADLSVFQPREKLALLDPRLNYSAGVASPQTDPIFRLARQLAAENGSPDLLSQMQYTDQMMYLPDDILVKVDRASMVVALEARAPLLDYRLAEFLARIPAGLRYHNRSKKYLLKKAFETILPDEILYRPKMGFGVPIKHWFRNEAADFARDILLSPSARQRGTFQVGEVERILERHAAGRRDFSHKIWSLLFFELWCREWMDKRPVMAAEQAGELPCAVR
jgi:asparagine synthase (glutamine-hydrolysing)